MRRNAGESRFGDNPVIPERLVDGLAVEWHTIRSWNLVALPEQRALDGSKSVRASKLSSILSMVVVSDELQIKCAPVKVLLHTARDIVDGITSDSKFFNNEKFEKLTTFSHAEIFTGRTIGRGGFCTVTEVLSIRSGQGRKAPRRGSNSNLNIDSPPDSGVMNLTYNGVEMSEKEYLTYTCNRGKGHRYVVKQVADEFASSNRITFLKGTVDLALEAKFLASLSHPNILEVKAVAEGGPFKEGYFLFLERLHETLPMRMKKWTTTDRQCKGITGVFVGGKKKQHMLSISRMSAAYGVANALNYIHSVNLVYRDIKPDNIGFDAKGNVKLFDFGLAKELKDKDKTKNGLYKLTGFTGSIRYMSPEVGLRMPYNQKADVYSYSMLLWYILALEPPYGFYTPEMFVSRVFQKGHRPVLMTEWPSDICVLMKKCWDARMNVRPSFETILEVIYDEVNAVDPVAARELLNTYMR